MNSDQTSIAEPGAADVGLDAAATEPGVVEGVMEAAPESVVPAPADNPSSDGEGGGGSGGEGEGSDGEEGGSSGKSNSLMSRIVASSDPGATAKPVRLSQDAHERLSAELEDLTTRGRVEIARIIETARELGDLKENGDYHAAKEEQGKMEGRIRHLQNLLEKAVVADEEEAADSEASGGKTSGEATASVQPSIQIGSVVTLRYQGEDEAETFLLASVEERVGDYDLLSPKSPLGSALLGESAGQEVSYEVPQAPGHSKKTKFSVEVLKVD